MAADCTPESSWGGALTQAVTGGWGGWWAVEQVVQGGALTEAEVQIQRAVEAVQVGAEVSC